MRQKIVVPEAPILVESTRSIGYSFEAALADIIDNSISAGAGNIYVDFQALPDPYVCIADDGCGMNLLELEKAMRYGSQSSTEKRSKKDLGRFGLGMKMASLSQCRRVTVISKKDGKINAAAWDLDYIASTQNWSLQLYSENEVKNYPGIEYLQYVNTGTVVVWQNFDRLKQESDNFSRAFNDRLVLTKKHVSLVFHRYLNGDVEVRNHIKIYFNGDEIHGIDPFLTDNPATQPLSEQQIRIDNEIITVKPYVLPLVSKLTAKERKARVENSELRLKQGFYIYRNKRLIVWGTWFRLIKQNELGKLAMVRVDIPNTLDSIWEIDIRKSKANLPYMIKKNLANIVLRSVEKSEKVYRYRGRKVKDDNIIHTWDVIQNREKYEYKINRNMPILKNLEESMDEDQINLLESYLNLVEETFPFGDVYCRVAQNEMNLEKKNNDDKEKIFQLAENTIQQLMQIHGSVEQFIESMKIMEPFSNYPDVVTRIKEEYGNE